MTEGYQQSISGGYYAGGQFTFYPLGQSETQVGVGVATPGLAVEFYQLGIRWQRLVDMVSSLFEKKDEKEQECKK